MFTEIAEYGYIWVVCVLVNNEILSHLFDKWLVLKWLVLLLDRVGKMQAGEISQQKYWV